MKKTLGIAVFMVFLAPILDIGQSHAADPDELTIDTKKLDQQSASPSRSAPRHGPGAGALKTGADKERLSNSGVQIRSNMPAPAFAPRAPKKEKIEKKTKKEKKGGKDAKTQLQPMQPAQPAPATR